MMSLDALDPAVATVTRWLVLAADEVERGPDPEDVRAGWGALAIFLALAVAVVVLAVSLVRHLRTAQRNKDAGAFGDESPDAP